MFETEYFRFTETELQLLRSKFAYKRIPFEQLRRELVSFPIMEGFWKDYGRLRLEGYKWNHKRVHRVYKQLGLSIRKKAKKRLSARPKRQLVVPDISFILGRVLILSIFLSLV